MTISAMEMQETAMTAKIQFKARKLDDKGILSQTHAYSLILTYPYDAYKISLANPILISSFRGPVPPTLVNKVIYLYTKVK